MMCSWRAKEAFYSLHADGSARRGGYSSSVGVKPPMLTFYVHTGGLSRRLGAPRAGEGFHVRRRVVLLRSCASLASFQRKVCLRRRAAAPRGRAGAGGATTPLAQTGAGGDAASRLKKSRAMQAGEALFEIGIQLDGGVPQHRKSQCRKENFRVACAFTAAGASWWVLRIGMRT